MAHVELDAPDLPWRYTPEPNTGAAALRPWLVLVVGTPAEVSLQPDGRVELAGAALFKQHPLSVSHRWAHVHETPGADVLARRQPAVAGSRCRVRRRSRPGLADAGPGGRDAHPGRLVGRRDPVGDAAVFRQLGLPHDRGPGRLRVDLAPARAAQRRRRGDARREAVRPCPRRGRPRSGHRALGGGRAHGRAGPGRSAGRRPAPAARRGRGRAALQGPRRRRPLGADAPALRRPVVPGSGRRRAVGMAAAGRRHRARRLAPPTARRPPPPGRGRARRLDRDRVAGPDLRRRGRAGRRRRGSRPAHPASGHRPARRRVVVAAAGAHRSGRPPCDALAAARPDAGRRRRQRAPGPDGTHAGPRAGAGFQCRPADAPPPRRARPVGRTRRDLAGGAARGGQPLPGAAEAVRRGRSPVRPAREPRTTAGSSPQASASALPEYSPRSTTSTLRRCSSARSRPKAAAEGVVDIVDEDPPELDCAPLDLGAFAVVGRSGRRPHRRPPGRRRPRARRARAACASRSSPSPTSPPSSTSRCGVSCPTTPPIGSCPAAATSRPTGSSRCRPTRPSSRPS